MAIEGFACFPSAFSHHLHVIRRKSSSRRERVAGRGGRGEREFAQLCLFATLVKQTSAAFPQGVRLLSNVAAPSLHPPPPSSTAFLCSARSY